MLVLTRKQDEAIHIQGRIRVTVLRVQGNRVKLGIEAPAGVLIRRSELPGDGGQDGWIRAEKTLAGPVETVAHR